MGAAAVMGGAMDGIMNSTNQDNARRSSTPNSSGGGGFSSIFNLKSVISAATKTAPTAQPPAASTSNFFVSSPPVAPEPIAVDFQSNTAPPQKSVQGIVGCLGRRSFLFCFHFLSRLSFDEILF